ncbi:MAG: C-GCAxxG-C-C family protein [Promethearchaeota archaeon]
MDINKHFDNKIAELEDKLPELGKKIGTSCAALVFTSILDVLGLDDFKSHYFSNLAVPFSGFGAYRSKTGWKGPCGTVSGAIAAIGVIMAGKDKMKGSEVLNTYMKVIKFASIFEKEYGSVSCADICGIDLGTPKGMEEYVKNEIWTKKCQFFVLFAIDQVRKLMEKELNKKWS